MLRKLKSLADDVMGKAPPAPDPTPQDLLDAAQRTVADATAVLDGLYDSGAGRAEISDAEKALANADRELARAKLKAESATRVAAKASAAENAAKVEAARKALAEALDTRAKAAARIDTLAADLATAAADFDSAKGALIEGHRLRIAAAGPMVTSAALIRNAIERTGATPSSWLGDKLQQPSATDIAARERSSVIQ